MFWRKRSSTKEKDYEKLLEDIDIEIKRVEDNLRKIKIREDRSIVTWLYYSIPVYSLLFIIYSIFLYRSNNPWPILCLHATPLLFGLFIIIFIRKFISIWFKKQQMREEERNVELKKQQKEILEELKNKLKYYQTKNLIEKYELQEQPLFDLNGMPMSYSQMNQRMVDPNQLRHKRSMIDPRKQQVMGNHSISKQKSMPVMQKNKNNNQFLDSKYQQQLPQQEQQQHPLPPILPPNVNERKWIDKLMDVIVGDVNEVDSKYALVCNFCYTHCGLALPEEYKTFKYICPNCKKLNDNAEKYKDSKNKELNNIPNRILNTQSAPTTPLKETNKSDVFSVKPNLKRRSSTLLEEMDDSTNNTDTVSMNQNIQTQDNDYAEYNSIPTERTEEGFEQGDNEIEQYEKEIEQEKEIINYPENNNNNNNENDKNKFEDEIQNKQNKVIDNSKEQPVVKKNDTVIEKDSK